MDRVFSEWTRGARRPRAALRALPHDRDQIGVHLYIDRVPTDSNPADGPSRGDLDTLAQLGSQVVRRRPGKNLLSRGA